MKVSAEYGDFANVFSLDLASKLPKHTGINDYSIAPVDASGFIRPSKSPADTPILFNRKSNRSFQLSVNYRNPYNVPSHVSFNGHGRSYASKQAVFDSSRKLFCWLTPA